MAASQLRVVGPDETKVPGKRKRKLSITQAAATGSIREQLCALRERVAKTVEDPTCPPRDLAALSRRLMEITKEIAAIDVAEAEDRDADKATADEEWSAV